MLEIVLERAFEPEMMREQPCGICGAEFEPEAVLAELVTPHEYLPVCEVCLSHLARRAEDEAIPAEGTRCTVVTWRQCPSIPSRSSRP